MDQMQSQSYADALSNTQGLMNFNGWDNYQIWSDNTTFQLQPNSFLFVDADNTTLIFPEGPQNCCFGDVMYIYVMQEGSNPLNFTLQPNNFPVRIPNEWSQSDSFQGSLQSGLNTIINVGDYWMVAGFDNNGGVPINEEEFFSTVNIQLTTDAGDEVNLTWQDLDSDGPNEPIITVSGEFNTNSYYFGSITVLNETNDPVINYTEEILEEAEEHQFFYQFSEGLDMTSQYSDQDSNGNPVGIQFTLTTGSAGSGDFTVELRHEPMKPNNGLDNAGGETDIQISFPVVIN